MKKYLEKTYSGWKLSCPFCTKNILYTKLTNWDMPTPFYYSDESNDVLLRNSDDKKVNQIFENKKPSLKELESMWNEFLQNAPLPPNGGKFTFWANIKCPNCKKEIPYNNGVRDINIRIYEPNIILIDGAIVVGDNDENTWRTKVEILTV
jgi:hypothetical protein